MIDRRTLLAGWLASALAASAQARDSHLPRPASLAQSAQAAAMKGDPLVVLVSLPGCPYCELVRRNYLIPMRQSDGLHAVQVDVTDRRNKVLDFAGQTSTGYALSRAWRTQVTPTVLFFNAQGTEIAPRIEGVAVVDFFGSYLEERLNSARERLRSAKAS
jgi:thioredoxin-related protein